MTYAGRDPQAVLSKLGFERLTVTSTSSTFAHPDDPQLRELILADGEDPEPVLREAEGIAGKLAKAKRSRRSSGSLKAQRERVAAFERKRQAARDAAGLVAEDELIDQRLAELSRLERLMSQPPDGGGAHRGRGGAHHQEGGQRG